MSRIYTNEKTACAARWVAFTLCTATISLLVSGCTEPAGSSVEQLRSELMLKAAPTETVTIKSLRESPGAGAIVSVSGSISAGGHGEPWDPGKASFIFSDATAAAHDHGEHDQSDHSGHDHAAESHAGHDHAGHDHAGHDHSAHDHAGHDHAEGHSCPFCDRAKSDPDSMAIVQFSGKDGDVLAIDAQELLGVKADQRVTVQGRAVVDASGSLVINATGIYVHAETEDAHAGHDHAAHDHSGHDHSGHDHSGHDHSGHDHSAHEHSEGDHAGHDHSGPNHKH